MDTHEFVKDYRIDELDRVHGYIRHHKKISKGLLPYCLTHRYCPASPQYLLWQTKYWHVCGKKQMQTSMMLDLITFIYFLAIYSAESHSAKLPSPVFKLLEDMRLFIGTSNWKCTSGTSTLHWQETLTASFPSNSIRCKC